ncbi:hypothetical protein [Bosea thiooxidans]
MDPGSAPLSRLVRDDRREFETLLRMFDNIAHVSRGEPVPEHDRVV